MSQEQLVSSSMALYNAAPASVGRLAVPSFERPQPAPTVAEILASPEDIARRAAIPVYCHRDMVTLDLMLLDEPDLCERIVPTTEADLIYDLVDRTAEASQFVRAHLLAAMPWERQAMEQIQGIRTELGVVGRDERLHAAGVIAAEWLGRLGTSADGEIHLSITDGESMGLVLQEVTDRLEAVQPSALERIHVFDPTAPADVRTWQRRRAHGITIADDWGMSGRQMAGHVQLLADHGAVRPEDIVIQYICASTKHLQEGIAGAPVTAAYTHGYGPDGTLFSVMGSHASPDFGFRDVINQFYYALSLVRNRVKQQSRDLTFLYPLAYNIAKVYKWQEHARLPREGTPEAFTAFDADIAAYRRRVHGQTIRL